MDPSATATELSELLDQARECACYLAELGVETIETPAFTIFAVEPIVPTALLGTDLPDRQLPTRTAAPVSRSPVMVPSGSRVAAQRSQDALFADLMPAALTTAATETLENVWRDIGDCTRCGLCEGRTQVVNTHGNPKARLMFVGEAPGADEDAQGKPFVGRAGQLLTKMIEAMGMKREDVLIGNVNRCRPPGNRQPTLEEAAICRPFLFREIAAVQPDVIVVMGNTALRNLLEMREGISRVRGQFRDFRGIKVMPTFHPAYLLRDPSKKRETWEDLKKVRDYLDTLT